MTAGESHGRGLVGILEGVPAGLEISEEDIDRDLARRQKGFGRGGRMAIEQDRVLILSGVRDCRTLGSPIALFVRNKDWENWEALMNPGPAEIPEEEKVTYPRPGHADLAGAIKYGHRDIRNVLERASARETAARVACGAVARKLLAGFGVKIISHVVRIGPVEAKDLPDGPDGIAEAAEASPTRCADPKASERMVRAIEEAREDGDTLGGVFEVIVSGLPCGLGSYVHWDRRLDGRLAMAVMSIPGVKGVEIGLGFASASLRGSRVHDEIFYDADRGFYRRTNNAGGLEGGVTTGEPLVIRGAMKPIPTLRAPLATVDIRTKEARAAHRERSDVCAVPACSVVAEAAVALELGSAFLEAFGGDCMERIRAAYESYLEYVKGF